MANLKIKAFIDNFKLWDEDQLKELSEKVKTLFTKTAPTFIAEVKQERKSKQEKETNSKKSFMKTPASGVQIGEGDHTYSYGGKIK